ncbi:MAG: hypothetical protein H7Y01_07980 [Ferruginibacter sp.]|nr:hypothetical protein [Chitinophagaceae bacterium]
MSKKLQLIQNKVESIRYGLLRFSEGSDQQAMHVSTSIDNDQLLNCIIKGDTGNTTFLNRQVSLIQKNEDDYLYISGRINDEVKTHCKVVSLQITKACWFTRKRKGNTVWLQEKYIYQTPGENIEKAS